MINDMKAKPSCFRRNWSSSSSNETVAEAETAGANFILSSTRPYCRAALKARTASSVVNTLRPLNSLLARFFPDVHPSAFFLSHAYLVYLSLSLSCTSLVYCAAKLCPATILKGNLIFLSVAIQISFVCFCSIHQNGFLQRQHISAQHLSQLPIPLFRAVTRRHRSSVPLCLPRLTDRSARFFIAVPL